MNLKEQQRLMVLNQVERGDLTGKQAAALMGFAQASGSIIERREALPCPTAIEVIVLCMPLHDPREWGIKGVDDLAYQSGRYSR